MATREKVLADEADEQRCQEKAAHTAALAKMALAKELLCNKMAQLPAMLADEAGRQRCHEVATWEKVLANEADKRCLHETAMQGKALANDAESQHCQELAARAVALAELVLVVERSRRKSANCPTVSVETTLTNEHHCQ